MVKYVVPAVLNAGLPTSSVASFLTALASGSTPALEQVPGVTPEVLQAATPAALRSSENAFQLIYLVSIAFGCCAIIASLAVNGPKLYERMTGEVARKLQYINDTPLHNGHNEHGGGVTSLSEKEEESYV